MNVQKITVLETNSAGDSWEVTAETDPYIVALLKSLPESPTRHSKDRALSTNPMRRDLCGRDRTNPQAAVGNPYQSFATPRSVHDRRFEAGRREIW